MAHSFSDTISFYEGGLNWDDDIIAILPGDGRIRRNVTISDDGNFNIVTNLLGNTQITDAAGGGSFTYPSGTLKVVGFCENKEEKAGIFFVYSSAGEHSIIQYNSETEDLQYVLDGSSGTIGSILDFPATGYVSSDIIGNEDDKHLVWANPNTDPMAYKLSGDIYWFQQPTIYRKPLLFPIDVSLYPTFGEKNNVRGKIFQFAIRISYDEDNTVSVLSPYSEITVPSEDEFPDGVFVDPATNGTYYLNFQNIASSLGRKTQLCYRIVDVGGGAPSQWYIADTDPYYYVTINMQFSFDETGILIPPAISNKVYDYVPDLADTITVIDTNQIVLGGVTEGYDNLDPDDIDITFTEVVTSMTSSIVSSSGNNSIAAAGSYDWVITNESTSNDYYYKLYFTGGATGTVFLLGSYGLDAAGVSADIRPQIDAIAGLTTSTPVSGTIRITNGTGSNVTFRRIVFSGGERKGSFKLGSTLFFGIQYLKDGKPWFVQGNTDSDTTPGTGNPFAYAVPNASDLQGTYPLLDYYYSLDWEVNHLPPQDPAPTHWQWVYLGDNIDYHEAYLLSRDDDFTHEGIYTVINRSFIQKFRLAYGDDINYGFDIQRGDRFRIVGEFDSAGVGGIATEINVFDEDYVIDLEILVVTATEIKIKNIEYADFWTAPTTDTLLYCQIYRYKQINPNAGIYQAIAPIYQIHEIGGVYYHEGPDQDQTASVPATGSFDNIYFSNCFINFQAFINDNNLSEYSNPDDFISVYGFMETHNASLLYDSNIQQFGKPNIRNEFAERRKWNKIRYGGKYLDESGFNFMRSFDFDGERFLDDRNGIIKRLAQIGDTLKAYQERKVTSFYLKTTTGTGADGSQTMVFSDNVMSEGRQSVSDFGCTHYGSYVKTVREAYFFDIINGVVIKDTPGGMVPISDFKMHTYFKNKAREIIAYGVDNVLISGGWDEDLNMYMLSFYDPSAPSDPINETVAFYEMIDRWVCFCDFVPELYGKISGDTALTFLDGELWTQNTNATRNNFFGSQYEAVCDVVSKGDPSVIKVFESIEIMSTGEWAPSEDDDIEIEIPVLMQSRLLKGRFKRQEGVYLSDFLRDALDGTGTFQRTRLHNGRILRGYEMRVRLRNDDTTEANLRIVKVNSTISQ